MPNLEISVSESSSYGCDECHKTGTLINTEAGNFCVECVTKFAYSHLSLKVMSERWAEMMHLLKFFKMERDEGYRGNFDRIEAQMKKLEGK